MRRNIKHNSIISSKMNNEHVYNYHIIIVIKQCTIIMDLPANLGAWYTKYSNWKYPIRTYNICIFIILYMNLTVCL